MKKLLLAAAAALSLGAVAAPAQALVVGTADSSNSIPFGQTIGGYYFQQVYSAANFASALDITSLSFYSTLDTDSTTPRVGTFQFYLSYSSADIPSFDTNGSATPWADPSYVQVFDGVLPALVNGRLDFKLSTAFNYDPSKGKLLLTIRNFDGYYNGDLFLDADKNNGAMNSRFSNGGSGPGNDWNQGLVTGFNEVAAAPEPTTWALMIGGFGLAGAALRRRRMVAA